jgi:putative oxidoreductase
MKPKSIISLMLRLVAAFIMLQTLYFKFTGHPESVYIFTQVGMEPWGRIGTGVVELVASVLLLWSRTIVIGALIAAGLMVGALASHLFILGFDVRGDGGQLAIYAIVVLLASIALMFLHRDQIIEYKKAYIG